MPLYLATRSCHCGVLLTFRVPFLPVCSYGFCKCIAPRPWWPVQQAPCPSAKCREQHAVQTCTTTHIAKLDGSASCAPGSRSRCSATAAATFWHRSAHLMHGSTATPDAQRRRREHQQRCGTCHRVPHFHWGAPPYATAVGWSGIQEQRKRLLQLFGLNAPAGRLEGGRRYSIRHPASTARLGRADCGVSVSLSWFSASQRCSGPRPQRAPACAASPGDNASKSVVNWAFCG